LNDNPVCQSCIRWVKDVCTKNQQSPLENETCRFFIETKTYLQQTTPVEPKEFVTEEKTSIEQVELGRLRSENRKLRAEVVELRKLLPPDPVGELLTRLLPKLKVALEKNAITNYRDNGEQITIVSSFDYKKLKVLGLISQQDRQVTYVKKTWWFTSEFEAQIKQRLAETQVE
jgi:hypothetical protein